MEKHLQRNYSNVPFESDHPGCMWSIFHIFHFHQRFYNRKKLPNKKHRGGRQTRGIKIPRATGEEHDFTDGEVGSHLIEDRKKETSPTIKRSGKTRIKTLIAEEMSEKQEQKQRMRAFPAQLLRTESIHHLDCTDYILDGRTAVCENPTFELHSHETSTNNSKTHDPLFPKYLEHQINFNERCEICGTLNRSIDCLDSNKLDNLGNQLFEKQELYQETLDEANEAFSRQKLMNGQGVGKDVSLHPSKVFLDALDVVNENRELFLKILQDPNSTLAKHVPGNSNPGAVLAKCGSFPVAEFSGKRVASVIKLKQKQKEIRSYAKREGKSQDRTTTATPSIIDSSGDSYSESGPLRAVEIAEVKTSLESVPDSPHELKNHKEHGKLMKRFKNIKERIKHAIKESKKEHLRISMDGILHRIPFGQKASKDAKSDTKRDGRKSSRSGYDSEHAASNSAKDARTQIKRTPSLTESLDRYSHLLESILSRDNKKHLSVSLKLANEDGGVKDRRSSRTFQRILSMPETGYYFFGRDVYGDLPRDMLYRRTLSRVLEDGNADVESYTPGNQNAVDTLINPEKCTQLDPLVETESRENYMENISGSFHGDEERLVLDIDGNVNAGGVGIGEDLKVGENADAPLHGQETLPMKHINDTQTQASQLSVFNSCVPEDITSPAEVSVSEVGSEIKPRDMDFNKQDSFVNLQDQSSVDAPDSLETIGNVIEVQIPSPHADSDSLHVQVDRKDDADFNYVRDVLKISGFSGNELLGTWHSPNQPVDPSLFDEVECSPHKLDITGPDAGSSCDDLLLFDLINQVLLEIYERTFTYCQWYFCFNSNIRPMPVGYHVLEEVWSSISWHLNSQPQLHPSLEYVTTRDLAKNDGWMHLQPEAECLGLELEDWIVDDLLDEITLELAAA